MKLRTKILIGVAAVFGIPFCLLLAVGFIQYRSDIKETGPAKPYAANCPAANDGCLAWANFRNKHPFPYQSFAAAPGTNGTLIIILSEPAPTLSKAELDSLVRRTFGTDLISLERRRWYVAVDGWLEDLILKVKCGDPTSSDLLADSILRDRVAVLHEALFGTAFGGDLSATSAEVSTTQSLAPNLHVSPSEIAQWMEDPKLSWHRLDGSEDQHFAAWPEISANTSIGAFESADGTLTMLTLPTNILDEAHRNPAALDRARIPFREFAVASDDIFGAIWTPSQVAILGRFRTTSLAEVPPPRFETFALLASQNSDELRQSYERNTVFAGKLQSEPYRLKDWAPVYLSPSLIDTELGTLLNVNDQMLKSWSEAGNVEYLYFVYPRKPKGFPFDKGLSEVLHEKFKSDSTLFNWNTSGAAVIVKHPSFAILAAKQTGALPVTYGADGKPKNEGGEDLYEYEEQAYKYFADLKDPNLARAAQYTTLYQLFRAIAKEGSTPQQSLRAQESYGSRSAATTTLAMAITQLIDDVESHKITAPEKLISQSLLPKLAAFHQQNPRMSTNRLGKILADRDAAIKFFQPIMDKVNSLKDSFNKDAVLFDKDVNAYNALVRKSSSLSVEQSNLDRMKLELDKREAALKARAIELKALRDNDPLMGIGNELSIVATVAGNLETMRSGYVQAASEDDKDVPIRTASIVLSWDRKDGLQGATGGHNMNSGALRLQSSPDTVGFRLSQNPDGTRTLYYNPGLSDSVESHATDLARAVEHRGETDSAALEALVKEPSFLRTRADALELVSSAELSAKKPFGRLGRRPYFGKEPFVQDLRAIAEKNDCCIFVARDEQQTAYITEKNPHAPPPTLAYEIRDTPSLRDQLLFLTNRRGLLKEKPVIFLDEPEAHVQALARSLGNDKGTQTGWTELVEALSPNSTGADGRVSAIVEKDLSGKRTFLKTILETLAANGKKLLERLGGSIPKETWRSARITKLEREDIGGMLKQVGWDDGRDGIPTAIKVSFGSDSPQPPPDLSVIAGFSDNDSPQGISHLRGAHEKAAGEASLAEANLAQYLMSVRNELRSLPNAQVKRLILVVHEGDTDILLTKIELQNEPNGGS